MKKRLLLSLMAVCMSVAGFALSVDEYVYTPQGRFQITGENLNANSAFTDFTGWSVVSATADKTHAELFNINLNGYAAGINSIQSLDATAGEGIKFKFEPESSSSVYVVSYKLKGAVAKDVRVKTDAVSINLARVAGFATDAETGTETLTVTTSTAEELTDDWQTFNYAIVGNETPLTYYIEFSGMDTSYEIADVQIAPATQVADLRQRDAMLEKLNVYKNCYEWSKEAVAADGVDEIIEGLEEVTDETDLADLNELLETANDIIGEFLKNNMDDYLVGANRDNYFDTWRTKIQKWEKIGDWTCLPSGRGFWENAAQGCIDLGHFQNGATWNNGAPTTPMGVYMTKDLVAGSYVFSIEAKAAVREPKKNDWNNNDGLNPAYGVAYIVKIKEGADPDTILSVVKGVDSYEFTQFYLPAKVAEDGEYEIGFKTYCKEAYQGLAYGSVTYLRNAAIWGKNGNKYNQKQLAYEVDVREQITTGRNNLTTATANIANAEFFWGKATLQACVDTVETKIAAYEQLTQDEIIAVYDANDGEYEKSTSDPKGLQVYEIYQAAVRDIIAANRKFTAVNDTLNSLQTIITAAEETMKLRIYDAATGKADLLSAIDANKNVQTQMKATDYSEENAATIVEANKTLNEAIDAFKASVPASAIAKIVDIDFEQAAVKDEETLLYTISGEKGTMSFSAFSTNEEPTENAFEQGIWSNAEHLYAGYVRVGNGEGTVTFDPTVDGETMGTNILKISCDFFLQGLSGRNVGFFVKDAEANNVAAFYANFYNNTIDAASNLGIELGSLKYGSGSNYGDAAPEGAEGATGTVLAKNSFEVILDYGEASMYCTTTSGNGVVTTEKTQLGIGVPTQFVLKCNYNVAARRCWFDNLKIERIEAGETTPFVPTGVKELQNAEMKVVMPSKVLKNGRLIINGKYGLNGILIK